MEDINTTAYMLAVVQAGKDTDRKFGRPWSKKAYDFYFSSETKYYNKLVKAGAKESDFNYVMNLIMNG